MSLPFRPTAPTRLTIVRTYKSGGLFVADCLCSCGTEKTIRRAHVAAGRIRSCGCLRREASVVTGRLNTAHGQASGRSPTYRSWETMKSRCLNPSDRSFADYGGRGISFHPSWKEFAVFLNDMGSRPRRTTLDRKNVDEGYSVGNCRWATSTEQQRNRRNNRLVEFRGEKVPLVVVAERTGVTYTRLWDRVVKRGWSVEDAVSKPSRSIY